ncbi:hypothetical protein SAMN05421638_0666 [Kaistella treverensis]|uniref:Uncharacterized protein n=1 Tax=Kaistella treverensis TaxID=631455 RepID=A0A1I3K965_9FLAO|nr:hypothetical protein SAMN05421638_0666 [Kaistella treverensis]
MLMLSVLIDMNCIVLCMHNTLKMLKKSSINNVLKETVRFR